MKLSAKLFLLNNGLYSSFRSLSDLELLRNVTSKLVLISRSRNIFKNLALEDWIYTKSVIDTNSSILLLWIDDPCVVIGRHQNPWTEVYVDECIKNGITVSRRNSGGGTVYHDHGNLNLSFITNRKDYNRKLNLSFVSSLIRSVYQVNCEISDREDLVTSGGLKVSGTASKLSSKNAYHHCTLLVDSDLNLMRRLIRKEHPSNIVSNATTSIRSSVTNLNQLNQEITIDSVVENLAYGFSDQIFYVDPNEPIGLNDSSFSSWDWIFGRTPKFSIKKILENGELTVNVVRGCVHSATITTNGIIREISTENMKYSEGWVENFSKNYE